MGSLELVSIDVLSNLRAVFWKGLLRVLTSLIPKGIRERPSKIHSRAKDARLGWARRPRDHCGAAYLSFADCQSTLRVAGRTP